MIDPRIVSRCHCPYRHKLRLTQVRCCPTPKEEVMDNGLQERYIRKFGEESGCMIMTSEQIIADLKLHANTQAIEGMARFGIRPTQALGVSIPTLRKMAKEIGRNHALALALWDSGIHEARILASMIDEPHSFLPSKWRSGSTILIHGTHATRSVETCLIKPLTPTKRLSSGASKRKSLCSVQGL